MSTFVMMKRLEELFNLHDTQPEPAPGSLLVARPTVEDSCFKRSVILVVDHGEEGTMGLILNRVTNVNLRDVFEGLTGDPIDKNGHVPFYLGGPVGAGEMFFVHDLGPERLPQCEAIGNSGLYIGGDFRVLKTMVVNMDDLRSHFRFFAGYSGWEAGQLAAEFKRHDWAVLDGCDAAMILGTRYDRLWCEAVKRFGDRYRLWLNWPFSVHLN